MVNNSNQLLIMKDMIIKKISLFVALACGLTIINIACNKSLETHGPIDDDTTVPGQVTNIKVENGNGKATITYDLPKSSNLLYVRATYKLSTGQQNESTASYYSNSIEVVGFADTNEHDITLTSVSRAGVESAPLTVKVKPLIAPIWQVFNDLNIVNAFGGFNLSSLNPSKEKLSILVLKKNALNEYEVDNDMSVFTDVDSILSKIRGLDTLDYTFGFYVGDRWGNMTDTLFQTVKPIYETELSTANFRDATLNGDAPQWNNGETRVEYMWDGRIGWPWTAFTPQSWGSQPHMVTFNTGVMAKISRIWILPYWEWVGGQKAYYYLTTMKNFEIWGSDNPNPNGDLDNTWKLLGTYELKKPSGLPYGTENATDLATAEAGFSWEVDLSAPKVKYLRIRCQENFAGGTAMSINEIKVFGDPR